jgi:hypothetical protein
MHSKRCYGNVIFKELIPKERQEQDKKPIITKKKSRRKGHSSMNKKHYTPSFKPYICFVSYSF